MPSSTSNVRDRERPAVQAREPDHREADRVRAFRRPGGKDATGGGVEEGFDRELVIRAPVERVDEDDPPEPVKVAEPFAVPGEDLHGPRDAPGPVRLDGHAGDVIERRMDRTDRGIGEGGGTVLRIVHEELLRPAQKKVGAGYFIAIIASRFIAIS